MDKNRRLEKMPEEKLRNDGLTREQENFVLNFLRFVIPAILGLVAGAALFLGNTTMLILIGLIFITWMIPCKYDPAIQIKERQMRAKGEW